MSMARQDVKRHKGNAPRPRTGNRWKRTGPKDEGRAHTTDNPTMPATASLGNHNYFHKKVERKAVHPCPLSVNEGHLVSYNA